MKKWCIVTLALFLLFACHRDKQKPKADRTSIVVSADTINAQCQSDENKELATDEDSLHKMGKTPRATSKVPGIHEMKLDTAETTNLRLFTRKQHTIYSPALMMGIWLRETEHEEFLPDGKGRYWDTKDDVSRDEAQSFLWTMDSNLLVLEFRLEMGAVFYRQYVVTYVDDETLVYRDNFDRSYMWDKKQ